MNYKKASRMVDKNIHKDLRHDQRGDNYLIKNSWHDGRNRECQPSHKLWKKNNNCWQKNEHDLSMHRCFANNQSFQGYEAQHSAYQPVRTQDYSFHRNNPLNGDVHAYADRYQATSSNQQSGSSVTFTRKRKTIW